MRNQLTGLLKRGLPYSMYRKLARFTRNPPVGRVDFGDLGSTEPISRDWGFDRGTAIDRYYIEQCLSRNTADIKGRVLEVGDNTYTKRYGSDQIISSDVLHVSADDPRATIVADLTAADHIPSDSFDCIICTQTLHFIYDVEAVIQTLFRILRPGGVLLVTAPGISQISRYDMDHWGDYWRFTSASIRRLLADVFTEQCTNVIVYGNILSAVAFLHGLAVEELTREQLDSADPDYEVLLAVRAVKPESAG
jgi:SAM-dependent methyltransferase